LEPLWKETFCNLKISFLVFLFLETPSCLPPVLWHPHSVEKKVHIKNG